MKKLLSKAAQVGFFALFLLSSALPANSQTTNCSFKGNVTGAMLGGMFQSRMSDYCNGYPSEATIYITGPTAVKVTNVAQLSTGAYTSIGGSTACSRFEKHMTLTFEEPVADLELWVFNARTITDNRGYTVSVNVSDNASWSEAMGGWLIHLPGDGITSVDISNPVSSFSNPDDWLDPNTYWEMGFTMGTYTPQANYAQCSCTSPVINRPVMQTLIGPGTDPTKQWSMVAEVTDNDGLVLSDVRLGARHMAEKISVPYYTLETSALPKQRGELKPNSSDASLRSRLVDFTVTPEDYRLAVEATYIIDHLTQTSQSCLQITQRYEFYSEGALPCEPSGTLPCSNFKAIVNYKFIGRGGETLKSINIPQRNHFDIINYPKNTIALFRDCDRNPFLGGCLWTLDGLIFKEKENPLFSEYKSNVIKNGQDTGQWDNIHETYLGVAEEPPAVDHGVLGGCPECVHMHWRWGAFNGAAFNNGLVKIPTGSNQDLDFAIVRNHTLEEDPVDYKALANQEPIRHPTTGWDVKEEQSYDYTTPDEVVVWYSGTGYQPADSFFTHGGFFNAAESDVDATINRAPSGSNIANAPTDSGISTKETATASASTMDVGSTQDGPTSVHFAYRYKDGPTTFTDVDPATVGQLPAGYTAYDSIGYDVETEASVSGPNVVTFNVASVSDQATFNNLRILHAERDPADPGKVIWVDRTVLASGTPPPNFATRNISARVNLLGPFVIATLSNPQPPITAEADLAVSIRDSADPLIAGNNLTYTLGVTNNGTQTATEVVLINGLSPNVDFVSATSSQGSCVAEDGRVVCQLSQLSAASSATVSLVVKPTEYGSRLQPGGEVISLTAFVRARENDNVTTNNSATEGTTILPKSNAPPTVKITSPVVGSLFAGPANLTVSSAASDGDGTISKVEFYADGNLIGTSTTPNAGLYNLAWSSVPAGEHTLAAVATDNAGATGVSTPVRIIVNGPATINITSPIDWSLFNHPATVTIKANASHPSGSISKVEFFSNGFPVGVGTLTGVNQYSFTWDNALPGTYSLTAIATDSSGAVSTSAPVNVKINDLPKVRLISPTSGTFLNAPADFTLTAKASDADGSITKVYFYANGNEIGGDATVGAHQFSCIWSGVSGGNYSITAVAFDSSGAKTTSSPVNVTVNMAPTVSFTSPANGATYTSPASLTMTTNAGDSDGTISKVDFFANGSLIGRGTPAGSNLYSFTWTNVIIGNYSLTAVATDNNGATAQTFGPQIKVTSPALLVAGSTTLSASDASVKSRLEALNYVVTVKDSSTAIASDASGKALVVISSTVTPTAVGTKFRDVAVPVVTWESGLFYDMGMTTKTSSNFGTASGQTQVKIINPSHQMAAGFPGLATVVNTSGIMTWGKPGANAESVATIASDATRKVIFGYQKGVVMPGLTAPARRVGFFMYDTTATSFNNNGWLLFDAAIKWATGRN
jgi:uncharacterized repeat protein (TIGR01451 family)